MGRQTGRWVGRWAGRQAGRQAGRHAGRLAAMQAGRKAGRQAGMQAGRQEGGQAGRLACMQAGRKAGRHACRQCASELTSAWLCPCSTWVTRGAEPLDGLVSAEAARPAALPAWAAWIRLARAAPRAVLLALLPGLLTTTVRAGLAAGGGLQQSWGTAKDCTPDTAAAREHWNRYWPGVWPLTVMVEPHTMRPSDT